MKKIALFIVLVICAGIVAYAGTYANVVATHDLWLTIDKGAQDGVKVGMKGIVKAVYKDPSGEYDVNIGIFEIRSVEQKTAEAYIKGLGSGFRVEDARFVVFENTLEPGKTTTTPVTTTTTSKQETVLALIDQGDAAFDQGNYEQAQAFYQKALALEPKNAVAKDKNNETEKKIKEIEKKKKADEYLAKSDASYQKGDIRYAFLYLVEAFRFNPENREPIASRLNHMAEEHPQEIQDIMEKKQNEIKDIHNDLERMLPKKTVTKPESGKTPSKMSAESKTLNNRGYEEVQFPGNIIMIYIRAGQFTLGTNQGEEDEGPAHRVNLNGYWIGKTEVTFAQYDQFCEETGTEKPADEGWGRGTLPVINVSWEGAQNYCRWLAQKTGLNFRLPSEAEWEKAAYDLYPWGTTYPDSQLANFAKNVARTSPVGSFPQGASRYGVLDMAGNVWEWVLDWYSPQYYSQSPTDNPLGPTSGSERCVRGGGWTSSGYQIRSSNRSNENPTSKINIIGFRLAMDGLPGKDTAEKSEQTITAVTITEQPQAKPAQSLDEAVQKVKAKAEKFEQNSSGYWEASFPNNIIMVYIPTSRFTIGSPEGQGDYDEHPNPKIELAGYWIGKTEVTVAQYDQFCEETGTEKPADEGWGRGNLPVINVSWEEAQNYCRWLATKTGLNFRLPSETEWEMAAHDYYPWGTSYPNAELANFGRNINQTAPVGSFPRGACLYGALDLAGNVWEWLQDWYDANSYAFMTGKNPKGPERGTEKSVRGGCWSSGSEQIRSANRSSENPASKLNVIGFRLALSTGKE